MLKRKILIVEDEIIIGRDIEKKLKNLEYEVAAIVGSGDEALEEIRKGNIDLILMDIMIKGKKDGIETAEEIKKEFNVPLVFLTAHSDDLTLQRAKLTEPYGYILKPIQQREFQIVLEIAFYKSQAEQLIKTEKAWLYSVMDCVEQGLIAIDPNERIKYANQVFLDNSGYEASDCDNRNIDEWFRANGTELPGQAVLKKKDGKETLVQYRIKDFKNLKEGIEGKVLFIDF